MFSLVFVLLIYVKKYFQIYILSILSKLIIFSTLNLIKISFKIHHFQKKLFNVKTKYKNKDFIKKNRSLYHPQAHFIVLKQF